MQESKCQAKKTYESPKLVVHGPVGKITGFDLGDLGLLGPERVASVRNQVSGSGAS